MIDYEYHRAYDRERARVRKAAALCVVCGKENVVQGRKYGAKCKAARSAAYKAKKECSIQECSPSS